MTAVADEDDLTIQQVADHLGLDRTTVSHLIRDRRLNAKRVPGKGRDGAKRVPRAELLRFLNERSVPATQSEDPQ